MNTRASRLSTGTNERIYVSDYQDMCYIRNELCVSCRKGINAAIVLCDKAKSRYASTYAAEGVGVHAIPYMSWNVDKVQNVMKHEFDSVDRFSSLCRDCYMRTYANPAESAYVGYRTAMDAWMLPKKMG